MSAIDLDHSIAMDDSCQFQFWAKGHHSSHAFLRAIRAEIERDERDISQEDLRRALPVRRIYWRKVRAGYEEDEVNFGEGFKFIEAAKGPGAFPVTLLDEWFPTHAYIPKERPATP